MAEMLSPGVFITEIDASVIVPTVSNSVAVFAGKFKQGPVNKFQIITTVDDLITYYGKPTNENYNDFYQCYNFLQYSNKLLISRAANIDGTYTKVDGALVVADVIADDIDVIEVNSVAQFSVGDLIALGTEKEFYSIVAKGTNTLDLDRKIEKDIAAGSEIYKYVADLNGVFECTSSGTIADKSVYYSTYMNINNFEDFEMKEQSIAMSTVNSKLKVIAKNPGTWCEDLEIAIALPADFKANNMSNSAFVAKNAFNGISLDSLFEYAPTGTEVGIIVSYDNEIKEIFTVDFNESAKDINNKTTYIETVINSQSSYIFVKENKSNPNSIQSYTYSTNGVIKLVNSMDSDIQANDLISAYEVWENKEEIDIDIIIGNELDEGASAIAIAEKRADCLAFVGASYGTVVGKKNSDAVSNLINWRSVAGEGLNNANSMFTVACANYKYQYDRYNDKNRWINIAGDVAGLRSAVNSSRASWWASAGLERGQIKNAIKLAFNPKQAERDYLYKNSLNPIVSFTGQGIVVWGQKTLTSKPSSSKYEGLVA